MCGSSAGCKIKGPDHVACLNVQEGSTQPTSAGGESYFLHDKRSIVQHRERQQVAEIQRTLELLHPSGSVFEVRILGIRGRGKPHNASGYFTDALTAAKAVMQYDAHRKPEGIYVLLNSPDPAVFARSPNKITDYLDTTTSDSDIIRRCWLIVDCDPQRPRGVASTSAQLAAAEHLAANCKLWLRAEFAWPDPVEAMSGNGYYLLYALDLPNDEQSKKLLRVLLKSISHHAGQMLHAADLPRAHVDLTTFNAARVVRLLGTTNRKGHDTAERPHRRSKLLAVPSEIIPVPLESLQAVAAELPEEGKNNRAVTKRKPSSDSRWLKVDEWLDARGVAYTTKVLADGRTAYLLAQCPFDDGHGCRGETCIMQDQAATDRRRDQAGKLFS
jgi:hypothetical protein